MAEPFIDRVEPGLLAARDIRKGWWVAGAFFVGFLGWAALCPLDSAAVAEGVVSVAGGRQLVQHREGGTLSGLKVVEGQTVRPGELLAVVSHSDLLATERSLTGEHVAALAQRERLLAETRHAAGFGEPAEFAALSAEDRPLAAEAMAAQRDVLATRRNSLTVQQQVLSQRANQSGATTDAAQFQIKANREQRRLIADELNGMRDLAERGFVSKNRIRQLERAQAQLDGAYGALTSEVAKSRDSVGEMNMQAASLRGQRAEDVAGQLRDVQQRLSEIQPRLVAAKEQLARASLRATVSGRVVNLRTRTLGGVIQPGETLMEIVPQDRKLVIQAHVAPVDSDGVRPGMAAQVQFASLHDRSMAPLEGKVSKVGADSLEDQRTGQRFYQIEITLPETELKKVVERHGTAAIRAGIPAEVIIPLRSRTVLGYLLEPVMQTLWRTGRER